MADYAKAGKKEELKPERLLLSFKVNGDPFL